ncbi:hypothetical protein FSP39_018344 [Pinctada imbricata]|uniref:Uncharacterized protein n=1 Tax=Pinctada imbricata TaxID=66713 RepID=A0AA88Y4H8_PINIB|nr:hypothetical protein FSP39_018344 [Pinctada imbricata]
MKCVNCDGAICFLEISLSKEDVQNKDNCKYKDLSESVMEALNVGYCHKLIEHRENINNILKHDVYVLFLHLTHRGGVLEKSHDSSDYRRTLVKCLMERSNNVLIVVTQHDASNHLEGGLVSTDLKCVKGDATLEELKENGCLLSIKDKFTLQQIQHIRSVLPLKCRGKT